MSFRRRETAGGRDAPGVGAPASGGVVVPALDGFRGMAALSVLLFHTLWGAALPLLDQGSVRSTLAAGYMGVDFFFVISGFVLFLPTVVKGGVFGDVRAYAIRRAARILPAYYFILVVLVFFHSYVNPLELELPWESGRAVLSFLLHLTFLQHNGGLFLGGGHFVDHGAVWTLVIEAFFYVLLPFVAAWYYRHPLRGFMLALLVSMSWKFAVLKLGASGPEVITNVRLVLITQLPTYLGHFAAGMTAAWMFVKLRKTFDERHLSWAVVPVQVGALVAILAGMRLEGTRDLAGRAGVYDHWTRPTYIALVFAVLLLATALAPARLQAPFSNPFIRWLGDISYGVYLWHLLFIGFAINTLDWIPDQSAWGFARLLMFVIPGSLLAGWLSLRVIERPVILWARTRSRRLTEETRSPADGPGTLFPLDVPPVSPVPAIERSAVRPNG